MNISDLERQLREYKEGLNPKTLKTSYSNGESEIDNISRNFTLFIGSNSNLKQLHEIDGDVRHQNPTNSRKSCEMRS